MKPDILDLIDFAKVNTLREGFYESTGFATAILDMEGGKPTFSLFLTFLKQISFNLFTDVKVLWTI